MLSLNHFAAQGVMTTSGSASTHGSQVLRPVRKSLGQRGKYCYVLFRLSLLVPLNPSHNLLVRGSNPCGTKYLVSVLTLGFVSSSLQAPQTHQSTYVSETKVAR